MSLQERRSAPRHRPVRDRAHLIWWGGSRLKHTLARLSDLSSTGAATVANELPPEGGPVWIGLVDAVPIDWVEARIVWSKTTVLGEVRFGLRFEKPCPNTFFRLAIWGKAPWEAEEPARDSRRPSGPVIPSLTGAPREAATSPAPDDSAEMAPALPGGNADPWWSIRKSRSSAVAANGQWPVRLLREDSEPEVPQDVLVSTSA